VGRSSSPSRRATGPTESTASRRVVRVSFGFDIALVDLLWRAAPDVEIPPTAFERLQRADFGGTPGVKRIRRTPAGEVGASGDAHDGGRERMVVSEGRATSERTGGAVRRSHTGIEAHSGQPHRGPAVETVARSLDGQSGPARSASAETTAVPTR
jgi:hypothetical protein